VPTHTTRARRRPESCALKLRLGVAVRTRRLALDLDQLALARLAGYRHASVICDIEAGRYNPTLDRLCGLAAALQTTVEELLR
jgi:transcriptional regulator with XRE-family HTH domain